MSCPACSGPTIWQGTLSRGRMVCPGCQPAEDEPTEFVFPHGQVSRTLARYYRGVASFHRDWCWARKRVSARPGTRTDPQFCNCGFEQMTPYSPAEIEQRENAHYGRVTP
jgi:hypothetical protein